MASVQPLPSKQGCQEWVFLQIMALRPALGDVDSCGALLPPADVVNACEGHCSKADRRYLRALEMDPATCHLGLTYSGLHACT